MTDKTTREHIVDAADRLFYRQGYEHTSFSDIADAVKISRGNFYHHFKTKDEILDAVISRAWPTRRRCWGSGTRRRTTRGPHPKLHRRPVANRADIQRYGCPVGTLCAELAKLSDASQAEANRMFTAFRVWLRRQFALLGREADADALAMHLLARSQGVAALASAFRDEEFIREEVSRCTAG